MTLQLRTLGQIQLHDHGGEELRSLLTQTKRLALLVYLACAYSDGRMCRRDVLLATFWPDSDDERARGALRQALHFIKQVAGNDVIITRGTDEVGVAAGAISIDARRLDELVDAGQHDEALAFYKGDFLDGFVLRGAPLFEQWAEAERHRLRQRAADARHVPDPPLGNEHASKWPRRLLVAAAALGIAVTVFVGSRILEADPAVDSNRLVVLPFVVRGPESLRYLEDGLPMLLGTRLDGAGELHTVDARALIVYLGNDRAHAPLNPEQASAVATKFGAQLYVLGNIVASGDQLRFSVSLFDRAHGADPVAHTEVDGRETDLVHMVDRLTTELLAARFRERGGTTAETAARTTNSLPALKAWLAGEAAISAGRYQPAMAFLREAIAEDSNFAMAHFRLAIAADWAGDTPVVNPEAERAVKLSDRLSPTTRVVLRGFLAARHDDYRAAARAFRAVLAEQPSSAEAWYELAEVLFHGGAQQGRPITDAREAFEAVYRLDPHNFPAIIHLARLAAARGDTATVDRLTSIALTHDPDGIHRAETILLRALALNDDSARRQFLALPLDLGLLDALWRSSEYTGNLAGAAGIADSLARAAPPGEMRASLHLLLAHLAMGRGRFADAERLIDLLATHAPLYAAATRLLLVTHPALPDSTRARLVGPATVLPVSLPPVASARLVYVGISRRDTAYAWAPEQRALARLAAGDSSDAVRLAAKPEPSRVYVQLRLMLARTHAERSSALREVSQVDSVRASHYESQSVFAPRASYQMAVARVLDAEGRTGEAYARLLAVPEDFGFNVAYLAAIQRQRAELLTRLGRGADAAIAQRTARETVK